MKFYSKLLTAVAAVALGTAVASADTIVLGSYGTLNGVDGTAPAVLPTNNPVMYNNGKGLSSVYNIGNGSGSWTAAGPNSSWVSFDPASSPTGGSVDPNQTYVYQSTFSAVGGNNYNGSISVLADDTVDVFLNGVKIIAAGAIGTDLHCADGVPNCLVPATFTFANYSLLSGINTLEFDVHQTGLASQGFDFYGSVTNTPEPGTLILLGSGLVGSAGALLRRKRAQA